MQRTSLVDTWKISKLQSGCQGQQKAKLLFEWSISAPPSSKWDAGACCNCCAALLYTLKKDMPA